MIEREFDPCQVLIDSYEWGLRPPRIFSTSSNFIPVSMRSKFAILMGSEHPDNNSKPKAATASKPAPKKIEAKAAEPKAVEPKKPAPRKKAVKAGDA